jgi:hypothetical protein
MRWPPRKMRREGESRLAREAPMVSWGGVRSGFLLALSGGRRGRLQARIFPRYCHKHAHGHPLLSFLPEPNL